MPLSASYTDDVLRRIGRNIVNFQKLEHALRELVKQSSVTSSQAKPQPSFPHRTKRLKNAGLSEVVRQFNRVVYEEEQATASALGTDIRLSATFRLELDFNGETQRNELTSLARERNRLVHRDLYAHDFSSESACLDLSRRLDEQNARILRYLEFVRSIGETRAKAVEDFIAFLNSDELLRILASNEPDA